MVGRYKSGARPALLRRCYDVVMLDLTSLAPVKYRLLKRRDYDQLVEGGAFRDERVELLYGRLIAMTPQGSRHSSPVEKLTRLLVLALGDRASVRVQMPLIGADESEPEPDLAVVALEDHARAHPAAAFLVIEVADTSLEVDRAIKARLYADSNVREYWIVDVKRGEIEVYREPADGAWKQVTRVARDGALRVAAFPDVELKAVDFLP